MKIHTFAVGLLTAAIAGQVLPGRVWGVEVAGAVNSALTYRQVFETAEQRGVGKFEGKDMDMRTVPLDEKVTALLNANQDLAGLVKRAAGETRCDWGSLPTDMTGVMKVLNQARTTERLMMLQGREDLREKRPGGAVEDWLAAAALARRVGEIKLIVASLVQVGMEVDVIERIAAELPGLSGEVREKLAEGWTKLPAGATEGEVIMSEYAYAQKAIVQQNGPKDWIDVLQPFYKAIAAAEGSTPAEFDKVVDDQMAKFKLNPFAQTIGPSMKRIHETMALLLAKRAMLETAMRVVQDGKGEVAKSKDPFGAGPFEYEDAKGGFELKSALMAKGAPLKLRVGK